jgi:hypothetical protein
MYPSQRIELEILFDRTGKTVDIGTAFNGKLAPFFHYPYRWQLSGTFSRTECEESQDNNQEKARDHLHRLDAG